MPVIEGEYVAAYKRVEAAMREIMLKKVRETTMTELTARETCKHFKPKTEYCEACHKEAMAIYEANALLCKHGVSISLPCALCMDEGKPDSQLNELISNLLKAQALTMMIVTELTDKVRNLEYAVKERQQQENDLKQYQDRNVCGKAAEASDSNSAAESGEGKAEEKETIIVHCVRHNVRYDANKESCMYCHDEKLQQEKEVEYVFSIGFPNGAKTTMIAGNEEVLCKLMKHIHGCDDYVILNKWVNT